MRIVLLMLLAIGFAAPAAQAKAKEKANKTKCSNALRRMQATADQGIRKMLVRKERHLPTVLALLEAGQDDAAAALAAQAVAQIDHHGHVTVLKIQATADACLASLSADGTDADLHEQVAAARDRLTDLVTSTQFRIDSFFDI